MFNQYDLIRWESQRYNERLEKLFVAPALNIKPSLAERAGLLLGRLLGGISGKSKQARRNAAYMGHGAVAR